MQRNVHVQNVYFFFMQKKKKKKKRERGKLFLKDEKKM